MITQKFDGIVDEETLVGGVLSQPWPYGGGPEFCAPLDDKGDSWWWSHEIDGNDGVGRGGW